MNLGFNRNYLTYFDFQWGDMHYANKRNVHTGQGMVEFSLVLPVLLLIIFGIIGFGHLFFVYSSVVAASREAARWGTASGASPNGVPYYKDCTGIVDAAVRVGKYAGVGPGNVQIHYDNGPDNANEFSCPYDAKVFDRIKVSVTVDYRPIVPLVNIPSIPLTATTRRTIMLAKNVGEVPAEGSFQTMTSLSLVPYPDPNAVSSKAGNTQEFTILVTASDGSVPTGTITFKNTTTGENSSCGVSWGPSGTAKRCSFTFNQAGAHNLVVTFVPTGSYIGPTPVTLIWHVASKLTTTTFTSISPLNQQSFGKPVDLQVNVAVNSPDTGIPNGNVRLFYGGDLIAETALNAQGNAIFHDLVFPKVGTHEMKALYVGNSIFAASQSITNYTINNDEKQTILNLSASPPSGKPGSDVTFTVNARGMEPGDPVPTGSVTISDNASHSCTASLDSTGKMSCTWRYSNNGSCTVTASYSGDANYESETISLLYLVTQSVETQTSISVNPRDGAYAYQPVTITVKVTSQSGIPTGTVDITGDGGLSCPIPLPLDENGEATCKFAYTEVNSPTNQWPIRASYKPSNEQFKDSHGEISYTVSPNDTKINITPNPGTINFKLNQPVTFTVQVESVPNQDATPIGTVSVTGNGINCPALELINGQATCKVTFAEYNIYKLDVDYRSSSSAFINKAVSYDYYALPVPEKPAAKCPQPPDDFEFDFSTAKQMRFNISVPNNGWNQSISSIDVYWYDLSQNLHILSVDLLKKGNKIPISSGVFLPTVANITPSSSVQLNKKESGDIVIVFDHDLGSGIYVAVVKFTNNNCSLTVRSER